MIIGFAGKAQSGKTTAAHALVEDQGFRILSFGSGIKEECVAFLERHGVEFSVGNFYGNLIEKEQPLHMNAVSAVKEMPEFVDFIHACSKHKLSTLYIRFSARQLMQWWGTDYRRRQDPHYWVKRCMDRAAHLELEGFSIAIDDVRFENEANAVRMGNGVLWRIERTPQPDTQFVEHISETALDHYQGFEGTIYNSGTKAEFVAAVKRACTYDPCGIDSNPAFK